MKHPSTGRFEFSDKKRALLEALLEEEGLEPSKVQRIPRRTDLSPIPLSFAQQRLWFLDQLEPQNVGYSIHQAFHLKGKLNQDVLKRALNEIIQRHEVLRTVFQTIEGEVIQLVVPALQLSLPIIDLHTLSETERNGRINRLPADFSNDPTVRQILHSVREMTLDAYSHQDLPFKKLVEELRPERDLSHSPIFQILFVFQNLPRLVFKLPDLTITPLELDNGAANFDLSLYLRDSEQEIDGNIEYNTDLFDASTIARLSKHFQTLLEGIVADPGRRLSELPLLSEAEREQILVEWNRTEAVFPRALTVPQLFEAQVERTPDAVAVVFEQQSLTYRELNARANQLAHYLRKLGVEPDTLVGLCVERSLEMVVALLGILKAGGAYVPLDPTFPKERLAYMLDDSGAKVLLTQSTLSETLVLDSSVEMCLDTEWTKIAKESSRNPSAVSRPEDLAYVIYTSGSTGKPKGVQIEHRSVVNFLESMRREPGISESDVLLAVTTLSFDIAGLEIYLPLTSGTRLVLATTDKAADGTELAKLMVSSNATVMQATPATWRLLLDSDWTGRSNLKILCGGEALPLALAQQLLPKCTALWNLYGPTETTIWSTLCQVKPEDSVIFIGRPIANTQIYILDEQKQPVPIGVTGKLYIGGDGLARGYLNRPELTAEKFVPNPFSEDRKARLYDTGDLARYRADGRLECLGRVDQQVKLRGFRIELGEIEAVLRRLEGVAEAVVVARVLPSGVPFAKAL